MPTLLGKTITLGKSIRTGLTLSLALTSLVVVSVPSRARDGGEIAAGVIGGLALGALAGAAAAGAAPPRNPGSNTSRSRSMCDLRRTRRGTAGTKGERSTM